MATMRGIDVSHHNYDEGFRPSMVANEAKFLIAKATGGKGFVDPACNKMIQEALSLGMKFGFYHFGNDSTPGTAKEEAFAFIRACENYFGEGVPALDWETKNIDADWINEFGEIVHDETKVWIWVYSTPAYFAEVQGKLNANFGKWACRYGTNKITSINGNPNRDLIKSVSPIVAAWQFSSVGRVGTWHKNLDLDIFYGSESQWDAYAKGDRVFEENPPLIPDERPFPVIVENDSYKVTVERK